MRKRNKKRKIKLNRRRIIVLLVLALILFLIIFGIINLFREEDSPTFGMTADEAKIYWKNYLSGIRNVK